MIAYQEEDADSDLFSLHTTLKRLEMTDPPTDSSFRRMDKIHRYLMNWYWEMILYHQDIPHLEENDRFEDITHETKSIYKTGLVLSELQ